MTVLEGETSRTGVEGAFVGSTFFLAGVGGMMGDANSGGVTRAGAGLAEEVEAVEEMEDEEVEGEGEDVASLELWLDLEEDLDLVSRRFTAMSSKGASSSRSQALEPRQSKEKESKIDGTEMPFLI